LAAVGGYQQVYLYWDDNPSVSYYQLDWRIGNNNWQRITDHIAGNRFWHTGLAPGTTYEYRIIGCSDIYEQTGHQVGTVCSTPCDQCNPAVTATPHNTSPPSFSFTAEAVPYDSMVYVHWESLGSPPVYRCFVERQIVPPGNSTPTPYEL